MNNDYIKGVPEEWTCGDYYLLWITNSYPMIVQSDEAGLYELDSYGDKAGMFYDEHLVVGHFKINKPKLNEN